LSFRGLLLAVLLVLPSSGPASAVEIIGPEEVLRSWTVQRGDHLYLALDGVEYEFVTDPGSPQVSQLGDGAFHPMNRHEVESALFALGALANRLELRVLLLPYPRVHVLDSSCHGQTIVLSPGIREVPREHVWSTVVHEVGHAIQHRRVPEGGEAWLEYVRLRGIDDPRHHTGAAHRDRPREIFAEDFRYLYGTGAATAAGSIENPDLALPDRVPGLVEWFHRTVRNPGAAVLRDDHARAMPNPFRAPQDGRLEVRFARTAESVSAIPAVVHDLTGRRVRVLTERWDEADSSVFPWDGRADDGRYVAAGIYFVRWPAVTGSAARVQILR
jgi:hypothetical protein